jgi:hypothetical protein
MKFAFDMPGTSLVGVVVVPGISLIGGPLSSENEGGSEETWREDQKDNSPGG